MRSSSARAAHHMGMGFELADEGELYMICQGSGGGYGDVLERDPEAVMVDLEADYISHPTAREIGAPTEAPPEPRHVDAAAMYVADLLRIFAAVRVDGLLLDEGLTDEEVLVDAEGYRPVLNVAAHYQWPVWMRTDEASCWPRGELDGVAGWLGRSALT
jgi:hypothetical protein